MKLHILMEESAFAAFRNTTLYPAYRREQIECQIAFMESKCRKMLIKYYFYTLSKKRVDGSADAFRDGIVRFQTRVTGQDERSWFK